MDEDPLPNLPNQPETTCFLPIPTPIFPIEPKRVRRALARAGQTLANGSSLIARVATLLVTRLDEVHMDPPRILDLGCRTGAATKNLRNRSSKPFVVSLTLAESIARRTSPRRGIFRQRLPGLVADPTAIPIADGFFDAVIANMALHWTGRPEIALKEIRRVMRPGGLLLFTIPGAATLQELKTALALLDQRRLGRVWPRVPDFLTVHQLGDLIHQSGFTLPVVDRETVQLQFSNTQDLLFQLRDMGAGNHHRARPPFPMVRGYLQALNQLYQEQFGKNEQIPATIEILFGHGWKKQASEK